MTSTTKNLGKVVELTRPWQGIGPFIFASRLVDHYPAGNDKLGPAASLAGRQIGMDMRNPAGWSMYHGTRGIPGFPAHGHVGFETVSLVKAGVIDHADSTGAGARYGRGDVQWVTTGKGVQHSEMFPLLDDKKPNEFEMYQLWLNLPAKSKKAAPEFLMLWNEKVPIVTRESTHGTARVRVIAGKFENTPALPPPSASWAADPANDVAIWLVELEPGTSIKIPAQNSPDTKRMLYVHGDGAHVDISGTLVDSMSGFIQESVDRLTLTARGKSPALVLILQGKQIDEPFVQHGPFVGNSQQDIQDAMREYQRTGFGDWKWETNDPVYARDEARFADYGNGRVERPEEARL